MKKCVLNNGQLVNQKSYCAETLQWGKSRLRVEAAEKAFRDLANIGFGKQKEMKPNF